MHLVLFNTSFSSVWWFDSLKSLLLLLPALTTQDGNDPFVNSFAFQARLAPERNTHLPRQEILAPKCAARRRYWLHWKHPAEPQLWYSCRTGGTSRCQLTAQHQPHRLLITAGGGKAGGEWMDFPKSWGIFMGLVDLTLAKADFKCLQSTPGFLRLNHLAEEEKFPSQS